LALARNADGDANARLNALSSLLRNPRPKLFITVKGLINDKVLGTLARRGLAKFSHPDVPKTLFTKWPDRSLEWRTASIDTLSSRSTWAKELLKHIQAGKLQRSEISPAQARQIRALGEAELTKLLAQVWGETRDTPEARQKEIADWKAKLSSKVLATADAAKGEVIFTAACSTCHKLYGKGTALAPDLTGSDRHNIDYLLGNIMDPNAVVPADYRVTVLKLKDGRTLSGVIPEQTEKTLTLQTMAERLVLERSNIQSQEQLNQSFMPEGLLQGLGEENVRHLIRYLQQ
jgi:putative heme-binding domain-containing protein